MILVDTPVWIDRFRKSDPLLISLLESSIVLTNPFVIGEIVLGCMTNRKRVLSNLSNLASIDTAEDSEVMYFIEAHSLNGTGIGYIDAHLLASVKIMHGAKSGRVTGNFWRLRRDLGWPEISRNDRQFGSGR
jgi:hypothetical protein